MKQSRNRSRRSFLHLAAGVAAGPAVAPLAWAFPASPLRIVVGYAPGSAADIMASCIVRALSETLGEPILIEHRTGIGGNLAAEIVAGAAPDGRTLLMAGPSLTISSTLYERLGYNGRSDFTPVAALTEMPNVLLAGPSVPARTAGEFIAWAKAAGAVRLASAGVGTISHLAAERLRMLTGIDMVHVPYRGGAGIHADLSAGRVDACIAPCASAFEAIERNAPRTAPRILAVSTLGRNARIDAPSLAEIVPGYHASTWLGLVAPAATPVAVVARLNTQINAALADRAMRIEALGSRIIAGSPSAFGRLIAQDTARWATVIAAAAMA